MAQTGRKPKPTALKRAEGNPGKRKLNEDEPDYRVAKGKTCPRHLKGIARATWIDLAPQLAKVGVLLDPDRRMLEMLCQEYAAYREAAAHLEQEGMVQTTSTGFEGPSVWINISRGAFDRYLKAASHFGLTPSSRSSIEVKPAKKENPLEVFINAKRKSG